jgi:hypothetical protein
MSTVTNVLILIVLLALGVLIGYLILAVVRLRQLIEQVQVQVQKNVDPLLKETTGVMSNVNKVTTSAANVSGAISRAAGAIEEKIAKTQAEPPGRKVGLRIAREVAMRVAGLGKAATTLRQQAGTKEAPGEEEKKQASD